MGRSVSWGARKSQDLLLLGLMRSQVLSVGGDQRRWLAPQWPGKRKSRQEGCDRWSFRSSVAGVEGKECRKGSEASLEIRAGYRGYRSRWASWSSKRWRRWRWGV